MTDDDDTLTCCPDCRAADIRVHSASTINHDGRPPRYKCHECGLRFDEPAERRRESTTAANSGTAALEAANPDLVPDGGEVLPPEVLDVVDAPSGITCQLFGTGDVPEPCDREAVNLIVYDGSRGDETVPKNALACADCWKLPEADLRTDGGVNQTDLGRDPTTREVARPDHGERNRPLCPDCGQYVGASKGGGKPLPGTDAEAFGWECPDCALTLPSNCHGREAPMFNDRMAGLKVVFRDGTPRWVPVPERFVDDPKVRTDGGRDIHEYRVAEDRPAISYGPAPDREAAWRLAATTGYERVELLVGKQAMYELWTEVRNVPWPNPQKPREHDRLVRQVVHAANDADAEMLEDALAALGVPDYRDREVSDAER